MREGGGSGGGGASGGGIGIRATNSTIVNNGTIRGGGGATGIAASGSTIINDGTISNGISLFGAANILELHAGSNIIGVVRSQGLSDTLRLGGDVDSTFNVSRITTGNIIAGYSRFEFYEKTGDSTWTLTGTPPTGGFLDGNGVTPWRLLDGTLSVSSDDNLGAAAGELTFDGGILQVTGTDFTTTARTINWGTNGGGFDIADAANVFTLNQTFTGSGPLDKLGAGTLLLTGDSSGFTGPTQIHAGVLEVSGSLCGPMSVLSGGTLTGTGTVCDTTNFAGGTIAPGNSIGTLTVDGDYVGDGGLLDIETVLGDDTSATDLLVITGNTSGTTSVRVTNVGGGGAQTVEGIKIVDVGGTSAGAFNLLGDYVFEGQQAVVGGAYAYMLYQNGISTPTDGDWYLRSALLEDPEEPVLQAGVPLYEAYAGTLQAFNELGTLQQRVGNRSWTRAVAAETGMPSSASHVEGKGLWARIEGAHGSFEPETSTSGADYDVSTWKLQAGADMLLAERAGGMLIGGLTAHYGTVSADVMSAFGNGSIDTTGYGLGGTLTWYGNGGFYVDGQAQVTWFDSDLHSSTAGIGLADGNGGLGYALSVEAGQQIALGSGWSVTPQAQLAYSAVDFDDFTDAFGSDVSLGGSDSLVGRLGITVDYERLGQDASGRASRTHLYGIANLYNDFGGGSDVDVAGISFESENEALWGGLGVGGSFNWADDKYSVYGEGLVRTSLENFGDSHVLSGTVGFRVKW